MSDLQPEVTTIGEPAAQLNYAALPGDVTSLSDALQAPVSDLQPEVTTIGEPAAQLNYAALPGDVPSLSDAIQAPVSDLQPEVTTTGEPAAQLNYAVCRVMCQVCLTRSRRRCRIYSPRSRRSASRPAQVNYAALPGDVTSLSDALQAPVSDLQPEVTTTGEPAAQ